MIEIKKIYKADNEDVFVIKSTDYKYHSKEEMEDLLKRANKMYENGEYENCKYSKTNLYGSYKDNNGEFIGNEQIHILTEFSKVQDGIYLKYNGKLPEFWRKYGR